jgi:integrase
VRRPIENLVHLRPGAGQGPRGPAGGGGLRSKYLGRACERAGVRAFSPHALRRAAVDTFASEGVDIGTAASILGHSPKVVSEHYRVASTKDRRKAVALARLGCVPEGKVLEFERGG